MHEKDNDTLIEVSILNRPYKVRCSQREAHDLHRSAKCLEKQMQKIGQASPVRNTERIAVITALNLTHDLMKEQALNEKAQIEQKVRRIRNKIQDALASQSKLNLADE